MVEFRNDSLTLRIVTGLISFDDDGEIGYLIDNDAFTESITKIDEVLGCLNVLNDRCEFVFTSMMTEELTERIS